MAQPNIEMLVLANYLGILTAERKPTEREGRSMDAQEMDRMVERLHKLSAGWRGRARAALRSAAKEPDPMGKRLLEHGAICYANAARELLSCLQVGGETPKPHATGRRFPEWTPFMSREQGGRMVPVVAKDIRLTSHSGAVETRMLICRQGYHNKGKFLRKSTACQWTDEHWQILIDSDSVHPEVAMARLERTAEMLQQE